MNEVYNIYAHGKIYIFQLGRILALLFNDSITI
jgi:hypothetical protein